MAGFSGGLLALCATDKFTDEKVKKCSAGAIFKLNKLSGNFEGEQK